MTEKEYIERDYAVYLVEHFGSMLTWSKEDILSEIKRKFKEETTADVAEVKHGRWINPSNNPEYVNKDFFSDCSLCGITVSKESHYCPNCGAKMDGGNE